MKKIIRLTENELNTLIKESVNRILKNNVINLSESAGVNNTMFIVSDKIARQIAFKDVYEIFSDTRLIECWHDDYGNTYDNKIEYDGEIYSYELFYEPSRNGGVYHGETDGDSISINFYLIEKIVAEYNEMKRICDGNNYYDEEDEDDFDAYEYSKQALEGCVGIEYDIYKEIQPIVLHELTHTLNKSDDVMGRNWIKNVNSYNESDVRDFMYLFSTSEMNSRIASASALLINFIKLEISRKDIDYIKNSGSEIDYFKYELMPKILKHNEIKYEYMQTMVNLLASNAKDFPCSQEYLRGCMLKPVSSVYSLPFQLAINEDKLYKRSNPRQVLRLYASNPQSFEEKVVLFYKNLLEQYKSRLYKVCWHTYTNYSWNVDDLDNEYENSTKSWHNKIWGEEN